MNLKDRRHRTEGFRVPLVQRAVEVVQQMRQGQVSHYVFPGRASGKPLSNMPLLVLPKRMNTGEKKWLDPVRGRPTAAAQRRRDARRACGLQRTLCARILPLSGTPRRKR